jgi:hypothetical protein
VLREGFGKVPLSSIAAVFLAVRSDDPAVRDAGGLQLDEIVVFFFVRPFSVSLGFDDGLPVAFECRGTFFEPDRLSL